MSSVEWGLDPRLLGDTHELCDFALCRVLVMNDVSFPWLILVPRVPGAVEIAGLAVGQRAALMEEIATASDALRTATGCDKLNVAALGNVVAQLHVHIVARFRNDTAWPRPVWGHGPARPYDEESLARFKSALKQALRR